jgi:biopolymer transport protein ExbB/TolQ
MRLTEIGDNYKDKIVANQKSFFSVLDDFQKYYIASHLDPDNEDSFREFDNSKAHLQQLSSELFFISNEMQTKINEQTEAAIQITYDISGAWIINDKLIKEKSNAENSVNGSRILIEDQRTAYNIQYVRNIELFVGILIQIWLMYYLFIPNDEHYLEEKMRRAKQKEIDDKKVEEEYKKSQEAKKIRDAKNREKSEKARKQSEADAKKKKDKIESDEKLRLSRLKNYNDYKDQLEKRMNDELTKLQIQYIRTRTRNAQALIDAAKVQKENDIAVKLRDYRKRNDIG